MVIPFAEIRRRAGLVEKNQEFLFWTYEIEDF
jgi:hypothetical protein